MENQCVAAIYGAASGIGRRQPDYFTGFVIQNATDRTQPTFYVDGNALVYDVSSS